jgi:DNA-binding NarL/FixJ family response regulator
MPARPEDAGIKIVLEARDLASGYGLCYRGNPDVVVVDLRMRGQDFGGLSLIRRIGWHSLQTQILVFSMYDDPALVISALEASASVIWQAWLAPRRRSASQPQFSAAM